MRKFSLTALFLSVLVLSHDYAQPPAAAQTSKTKALKQLLLQRRNTLRSVEEMLRERHRHGTVALEDVVRATIARVESELELADSKQARIALLQKQVEEAKKLEDMENRRLKVNTVSKLEVLRARALRLKFEIALEREKGSSP